MKPETLQVIRQALKILEESKRNADDEQKEKIDGYMFCIRNCYSQEETVEHMTKKFPSLKPEVERNFFPVLLPSFDQKLKQAYLDDAEDWAQRRRTGRCDTAEEAQGETSTSHKCDGNCNRHPPTH